MSYKQGYLEATRELSAKLTESIHNHGTESYSDLVAIINDTTIKTHEMSLKASELEDDSSDGLYITIIKGGEQ